MKNNKSIYIVGIFMLITMVSIGYAILTGQLNINGSAKVKAASWDIYFANIKIKDGSITASVEPSISAKTTVNFEVELKKPGDFYEFNVDVVNDGDLDAMIESISITPELTLNQQKYLSYSVTYFDDVPLEVKDILHSKKARTLKVRVEYKKNISNNELVSSDETLNIKATIKYVQADSTAKESLSEEGEISRITSLISGDGTQIGDEIAIGNEHFYVIKNDGENITMLAKYNLNATTTYDSSTAYKQNTDTTTSPVVFNPTNYWGSNGGYVYDNRASISKYVNNYKAYLESLGVSVTEARLINSEEISAIGCDPNKQVMPNPGKCSREWVYSTIYWTGYANNYYYIFYVKQDGTLRVDYFKHLGDAGYGYEFYSGVRPVIVIPADAI